MLGMGASELGDLKFTFDERRTVQALGQLMVVLGARENYTKLLKILYLADRRSLVETGRTITGATMVAMANGPVLIEVYKCIKGEPSDSYWDQHIASVGPYDVELLKVPGDETLSDYDVDLLVELAKKHFHDDYSRMIDVVHALDEWDHPRPNKVKPLPAQKILAVEDVPQEDINALVNKRNYIGEVEALLESS
jgi:uncharacterized phage-associated protein